MFKQRLKLLISIFLLISILLIMRLGWLQVFRYDQYCDEAIKLKSSTSRWTDTARGGIYDRNGQVLVRDEPYYQVCLHYQMFRLYDDRLMEYAKIVHDSKLKRLKDNNIKKTKQTLWERCTQQKELYADNWLLVISDLCDVPVDKMLNRIQLINDRVFQKRIVQARRHWFEKNQMEYIPLDSPAALVEDYYIREPSKVKRLKAVFRNTSIVEMSDPQILLKISPDVASEIVGELEMEFAGVTLTNGDDVIEPVTISTGKYRNYIYNDAACHIIGQLGPAGDSKREYIKLSEEMPSEDDLKGYMPGDRLGAFGMEMMFETHLRGSRGWQLRDSEYELIGRIDPILGEGIVTSVDIDLQMHISQVFAGKNSLNTFYQKAAAVIIDVPTGEVLAAVSVPTYDLNTYWLTENYYRIKNLDADGKPLPEPRDIDEHKNNLYINRALTRIYPPGSTAKVTYLLSALEDGLVGANQEIYCEYNGSLFNLKGCNDHPHGNISARDSITKSCNIYYYDIANKITAKKQGQWLRDAGFVQRTLAWPEPFNDIAYGSFKESIGTCDEGKGKLSPQGKYVNGIGRGCFGATVLQMASSFATIARDGIYREPTMMISPAPSQKEHRIGSLANVKVVQDGMYGTVNKRKGTAYRAFASSKWSKDKLKIYGKTGTTEFSTFGCYAKASDGRNLALVVFVEVGSNGGDVAAPLALDILEIASDLGYLPAYE